MGTPLRVLLVEDNPNDAGLLLRQLSKAGFDPDYRHVDNEADFVRHLHEDFDIILSDFYLPQFSGLRALELLRERGLDVPFILVSGTIGEEVAVKAMQQGAADYLLKDRLARLGTAVEHAIEQGRLRRERKGAEDELRLFRALVDQSDDTFEVVDPYTGRFLDVNAKACLELGYTREEYLKLRVFDIDPTIDEADWKRRMDNMRVVGLFQGEGTHRRKDGSKFPVEVRVKWVRLGRDYLVIAVRDISRRRRAEKSLRESEERFRQLAENIHEVFWMTDPHKLTMLYVSPAYESIWGRSCESLYKHPHDWLEAIHPDDRDRVREAIPRQADGSYQETYRIVRPDGTIRWVHDQAFPIEDAQGKVYRIVGTAADITEGRNLEEQFRQTQKLEAIGTLAGGIAHDFNNILGAIIGYVELTKTSMRGGPSSHYLDLVLQGAHRAASLVRQILAFSRGQEQQRVTVQLRHVVAEPIKLLRATIPAMIEFNVSLARDLPVVRADPTQVHQVVMNLCTNAAHAMRGGPGRLGVKLDKLTLDGKTQVAANLNPGQYVRLTVSDTGVGIDEATLERIFEPFFTTKGPGEGTGLGLSVVHGIMQSHEGAVTVQSRPGQGSTFQLYFPAEDGELKPFKPTEETELPRGAGQRVLFIDDEQPLAQLGAAMLETLGYRAVSCASAADALRRMQQDPAAFDLVITDLSMPGMTGTDLAKRLLALRGDLPIILSTGYSAGLSLEAVQAMGIREMLLKPLTLQSLGLTVQRVLAAAETG